MTVLGAESRDCIYIVFGCTKYSVPRAEIVYVLCLVVLGAEIVYYCSLVPRAVAVKSGKIFQPLLVNRTAHKVAFCKTRFWQQNMDFLFYKYYNISILARQPDCTHSCVLQKKTFATKHDTTGFLHGNISNSPRQHLPPVKGKLAHILQNRAKIPARRKRAKHVLLILFHRYGNKT